jgi:hypothetical protein
LGERKRIVEGYDGVVGGLLKGGRGKEVVGRGDMIVGFVGYEKREGKRVGLWRGD